MMKRWLIIQSDGQHKGQDGWEANSMMRECFAIQQALLVCGHRADVWGLRHDNYAQVPAFKSYDAILTIENYEMAWLPDLNQEDCWNAMRIYWLIDAHWQPIETFDRVISHSDVVLHSTRRYIKAYRERHPNQKHIYFPNGVDDRYFSLKHYLVSPPPRSNDLIFIGGKTKTRLDAIARMEQECGLKYSYGVTGMAYVRALLNAKMQFNKGINGDINYRNWETIGLGTCLLTEYDLEMEQLGFQHNVNCLFYRDLDEAIRLAKTYLANGEWKRIADEGYQFSLHHTYARRLFVLDRQI